VKLSIHRALLIDGRVVVIGSYMSQIVLIFELVGSCPKAKVGPTVDHIQAKGDIIA
jgi:hypothetical protein